MFTNVLQPTHLIILLAVVLLFLGPKRLPEAGRALGHGLREFKRSVSGVHDQEQPSLVERENEASDDSQRDAALP
jgi:sec-independent protein translocase protein TatA